MNGDNEFKMNEQNPENVVICRSVRPPCICSSPGKKSGTHNLWDVHETLVHHILNILLPKATLAQTIEPSVAIVHIQIWQTRSLHQDCSSRYPVAFKAL